MNSQICKYYQKNKCKKGDNCKFYHLYDKNIFISDYLVPHEEIKYINSRYSFIILIFEEACMISLLSLLEAKKFNYFRTLFETEMANDLKRLDITNEQYYYIIPIEFYENISIDSIKLFNRLRSIDRYPNIIRTFEHYIDHMKIDVSFQEKVKKDCMHLYNIFGFNY